MNNEKVIELAMKLKALAERGEGGEKDKARALMERLLAKHGMTIDDLEVQELKWHSFHLEEHQALFFHHIVYSVVGMSATVNKHMEKAGEYLVFCDNMEAIEIEGKFGFYWSWYQKDLDAFVAAFIRKNELYPKNVKTMDMSKISKEEAQSLLRELGFEFLATKAEYRKQLSSEQ